jgi:hypothetical protein
MDGLYASAQRPETLERFLAFAFSGLARLFAFEDNGYYRFIVRGAVAYGLVYHGRDVSDAASNTLAANHSYRDQILLGMPMVWAHLGERSAPPFGISLHESAARTGFGATAGLMENWWLWFNNPLVFDFLPRFREQLSQHYQWCAQRPGELQYLPNRIQAHREIAALYFAGP